MLTEFALTPSIFDEDAHEDKEAWRDQLRELISSMFPRTGVWPTIVSDLYAGSWSSHVLPYVERIKDHRAKKYCQDLLSIMHNRFVIRPECHAWPYDEDIAWCREAVASNMIEPIERIVSVEATKTMMAGEFESIRSIEEVLDSGFWRGIASDASPRMIIAEQVALLRKLLIHSEWVALINPYAFGNEQDFSLKLIEIALDRHVSFGPLMFEIHAQELDVNDAGERATRQNKVTNNMTYKIQPMLKGSNTVELYFWPELLDRIVIAGNYVEESGGKRRKSPRWGVSMSHVAHGTDPDASPTEWKLLRPERLSDWFRKFAAEDSANKPAPTKVSPVK